MSRRRNFLETKEDISFKEALKLFEDKQYKKALKLVDQNLKKKSAHPESLALKGLLLYHINQQNGKNEDPDHLETKKLFKKALKENENHPIIYHIIAIFYRAVQDYKEASRNYRLALENGSSNKNIWKDLAVVDTQLRNYPSVLEARLQTVEQFPGYRANWTGAAVAHHLNKNHELAERTLTKFEGMCEGMLRPTDLVEHSECVLYKNQIIFESGKIQQALDHLNDNFDVIFDKLALRELKALYHTMLGENKLASIEYRKLLQRNPDKIDYYFLLEAALQIDASDIEKRQNLYEKLHRFYPKADPPLTIPLLYLNADTVAFSEKLEAYLFSKLRKGVPSIFKNMEFLYSNSEKVKVIEKSVLQFLKELDSEKQKDPTVKVWTLYYISQHYLFLHDSKNAAKYIDLAIDHSPTLVELYLFKANILKHQGKYTEAAEVVDTARLIDLQDRFINCKTVKYYLRANNLEKAIEIASLFTKNDDGDNGLKDLHLMQANWYLIEESEAYLRKYVAERALLLEYLAGLGDEKLTVDVGKVVKEKLDHYSKIKGLAIKRYRAIIKNYEEFKNDQLDFHGYCIRKGTPRGYIDLIHWADNLTNQPLYGRVVKGMTEVLLTMENPLIDKYTEEIAAMPAVRKSKKSSRKKEIGDAEKVKAYDNDDDVYGESYLSKITSGVDKVAQLVGEITNKQSIVYMKIMALVLISQSKYLLAFQLFKSNSVLFQDGKHPVLPYYLNKLKESYEANEDTKLAMMKKMVYKSISGTFKEFDAEKSAEENLKSLASVDIKSSLEDLFYYKKALGGDAGVGEIENLIKEKVAVGDVDKSFKGADLVIVSGADCGYVV